MPLIREDHRTHYLIVGGGIAGCSLAYELSKAHTRVTLIEAGRIGQQGASAVPVALINPHRGRTARASQLDQAGLNAMWQLVEALKTQGLESGVRQTGVIRIASNEKQAKKWQQLSNAPWFPSPEIPAPYHAPYGGILIPKAGWLEPSILLAALVQAAKNQGVSILENCRLEHLEDGLAITNHGPIQAETIILCIGATLQPKLKLPKLEHLAGDVIRLATDISLPYPIAGAVYGAEHMKSIFVGGNHRKEHEVDPDAAETIKRSISWFIKPLKDAHISGLWTGVRAKQASNLPLIQKLEPQLWFYGAFGGRGFLCATYLSRLLAQHLLAPGADDNTFHWASNPGHSPDD